MPNYVQLDEKNYVVAQASLKDFVEQENMILVDHFSQEYLNSVYDPDTQTFSTEKYTYNDFGELAPIAEYTLKDEPSVDIRQELETLKNIVADLTEVVLLGGR